jgi:hypothetical protein
MEVKMTDKVHVWIAKGLRESTLTPDREKAHRDIISRYNDRLIQKGYPHVQINTLGGIWGKGYTKVMQPVDTMHVLVFHKRKPKV